MLHKFVCRNVHRILLLTLQPEYVYRNVLAHKDYMLIIQLGVVLLNVLSGIMVILILGNAYKVVRIRVAIDWILADFVFNNAHHHILHLYQLQYA